MKKHLLSLVALATLFVGCKTQYVAPKPNYEPTPATTTTTVVSAPKTVTAAPANTGWGSETENISVSRRTEEVSAASGEASYLNQRKFYVILGSFSVKDNALRLKSKLTNMGFEPGVLINESKMYRVAAVSYNDEQSARRKIAQIRANYPEYSDLWLLIKK